MLSHPAHVEAQLVGDDEQFLGVPVGSGGVTPALDVGEKAEPEGRGPGLRHCGSRAHAFEHAFGPGAMSNDGS